MQLKVYDIENDETFSFDIEYFFKASFENMSQIHDQEFLYLCGTSITSTKDFQDSGSLLMQLRLDNFQKINSFTMLVSSLFLHVKPALCFLKRDFLLVIGGRECLRCEMYHKSTNKWRILPNLPEERYGASLVTDDFNDTVFLVGGYCSKTKSNCGSVLRLNIKFGMDWDTYIIRENSSLLARSFHACIPISNNVVFILGGIGNTGETTDEIIELNLDSRNVFESPFSLSKGASFSSRSCADFLGEMILLDDENILHKILRTDMKATYLDRFNDL